MKGAELVLAMCLALLLIALQELIILILSTTL